MWNLDGDGYDECVSHCNEQDSNLLIFEDADNEDAVGSALNDMFSDTRLWNAWIKDVQH